MTFTVTSSTLCTLNNNGAHLMTILIKVVDAILAGNKVVISNDRETLTQVLNACCKQLKAVRPAERHGSDSVFHSWDDLVSNYIQFVLDTCSTLEEMCAGVLLAIDEHQYDLKIANPENIKSWQTFHDTTVEYLRWCMGHSTPNYKHPYAAHWHENQAERIRAISENEQRRKDTGNWAMFWTTAE